MLLRLKEVVQWTRMTALELMLHLVSIFAFSILVVTKVEGDLSVSWPVIFAPLFICDGLNAYLCVIIFVRQYREYELKQACLRLSNSLSVITLIFTFKLLLCQKLANGGLTCSEVFAPVFVLSQVLDRMEAEDKFLSSSFGFYFIVYVLIHSNTRLQQQFQQM